MFLYHETFRLVCMNGMAMQTCHCGSDKVADWIRDAQHKPVIRACADCKEDALAFYSMVWNGDAHANFSINMVPDIVFLSCLVLQLLGG